MIITIITLPTAKGKGKGVSLTSDIQDNLLIRLTYYPLIIGPALPISDNLSSSGEHSVMQQFYATLTLVCPLRYPFPPGWREAHVG